VAELVGGRTGEEGRFFRKAESEGVEKRHTAKAQGKCTQAAPACATCVRAYCDRWGTWWVARIGVGRTAKVHVEGGEQMHRAKAYSKGKEQRHTGEGWPVPHDPPPNVRLLGRGEVLGFGDARECRRALCGLVAAGQVFDLFG
jgi:hypothetical protein